MNGMRHDHFMSEQHRDFHRKWDLRFKVFVIWAACALLFAAFYPI